MLERSASGALQAPILMLVLILVDGCASVDPRPDYARVAERVGEATGIDAMMLPGDEALARRQVEDILAAGVDAEGAVRVALLQSREIQARLLEVGISRAQAVQAGLLSNPSLSALVRLPASGGAAGAEADLIANLIEIWQMPKRQQIAERRVEETVLSVARDAARLAAQTKAAFFSAVAAKRRLEIEEENSRILGELLTLTAERQQAGAATEIDVNAVRSELLQQRIITRKARLELIEARQALCARMGLSTPPDGIRLIEEIPGSLAAGISVARALEIAREQRLDLQAARAAVASADETVALEKRLFLRRVGAGVAVESKGTSKAAVGPAFDIELPIFDQNQAGIAKAELERDQARRRLEALETAAIAEVRTAHERFVAAAELVDLHSSELLPLEKENLELAQESFRLGRTGFLSVLEAERRYLDARRSYTAQLRAFALSIPELESAVGLPLSRILLRASDAPGGARAAPRGTPSSPFTEER
ncbi:MAG: TolC family protein [Planctomycetes bacterium]|nr:TolC family protein [Planctomycetota bacterium]